MIPGEDGELAEMSQKDATLWYAARTLAGRREPRRVFHGHLPAQRASRRRVQRRDVAATRWGHWLRQQGSRGTVMYRSDPCDLACAGLDSPGGGAPCTGRLPDRPASG